MDIKDLMQIARRGKLTVITGSNFTYTPWKILREEIFAFLLKYNEHWQPYIREIMGRDLSTEVLLRLLYQHMGEQLLTLFSIFRYETPQQIHTQLALLVENGAIDRLGTSAIDNGLALALQKESVVFFNDHVGNEGAIKKTLSINENDFKALSIDAEVFFFNLGNAEAILVAGIDSSEYGWQMIYGNLLTLAKQKIPIYWIAKEAPLSVRYLLDISRGSLICEDVTQVFVALQQEFSCVGGSETAGQVDLAPLSQWFAQQNSDIQWLHFIAILLKTVTSRAYAQQIYEEILAIYQQQKDHKMAALCYRDLGDIFFEQGFLEKAIESHLQAIHNWKTLDDKENLAHEHVILGNSYWNGASLDKAVSEYSDALLLYRQLQNHQGICEVTSKLALICDEDGDYELAKEYYQESLTAAELLPKIAPKMLSLLNLSTTLIKNKDWALAKQHLQDALAICQNENETFYLGEVYQHLGLVYMNMQDYPNARKYYEKVHDLYAKDEEQLSLTLVYCNLGHVCARLEDYEAAVNYYEGALESYEKMGDWQHLAAVYNNLGFINTNRQKPSMAEEYFSRAAEIFAALGDVYNLIRAHSNLARVYTMQRELENAAECYRANVEMLLQLGEQEELAATLVGLAMVQLQTQKHKEAISHLQKAVEIYDTLQLAQEKSETLKIIQSIENNIVSS